MTQHFRTALAVAAASLVFPALAQYKCVGPNGAVTLQQIPCPGALGVVKAPAEPPPGPTRSAPPVIVNEVAEALCKEKAPSQFKDPESVRILNIFPLERDTNEKEAAYLMEINAKNSYGGYVGSKVYGCVVDRSTKVVRLYDGSPPSRSSRR